MHQHSYTGQMPGFILQRQRGELFLRFRRTRSFDMAETLLHDKAVSSKVMFDIVWDALNELQDGLREGVLHFDFTTELLIEPSQWQAWGEAEHRAAGMVLRCLAGTGLFPLVELERKNRETLYYRPIKPLIAEEVPL